VLVPLGLATNHPLCELRLLNVFLLRGCQILCSTDPACVGFTSTGACIADRSPPAFPCATRLRLFDAAC
jgi:hypothetical protein